MSADKTYTFHHEAMKAPFEIHVAGGFDETYARQAADAMFREVDRLESCLTRFSEYSDIARIRLLEAGQSVKVAPETMQCLLVALWAYTETGGAFDVSLGRGMDKLMLNADTLDVGVGDISQEMALDLGGIGKGYALDNIAEHIAQWGIEDCLLAAGPSTVLALGSQNGAPWSIGVHGKPVMLKDQAISSSGTDVQGAHVLDPRHRTAAAGHSKTWVICPSATAADALSTAFMVMDTQAVERFCACHEDIQGHVLCHTGEFMSFE